jgi:uncharacterized membrane protein
MQPHQPPSPYQVPAQHSQSPTGGYYQGGYLAPMHYQPTMIPLSFDATRVVSQAWDAFKANTGTMVVATFIMGLLMAPWTYTPAILVVSRVIPPNSMEQHLATLLCTLITTVVSGFLMPGMHRLCIATFRGQPSSVGELFKPRGMAGILGYSFLMGLPGILVQILQTVLGALDLGDAAQFMGILHFLIWIPLLFAWLAWGQAPYLIADQNMRLIDAMKTSARLTSGQRGNVFLAYLLAGLVMSLGILACGIGALVTVPIGLVAFAGTYVTLNAIAKGEPLTPNVQGHGYPVGAPSYAPPSDNGQHVLPPAGGFGGS